MQKQCNLNEVHRNHVMCKTILAEYKEKKIKNFTYKTITNQRMWDHK